MTITTSLRAIDTLIWGPTNYGLARWQVFLKAISRTIIIFFREFKRDHITLRSCALTFTIVLSLVPVLALGTAVLKGLGAGDQMKQVAYRFIDGLETSSNQDVETGGAGKDAGLSDHLRRAADQIFEYVDKTDFATLGAFGIIGLVFSVLSVLGSIEQSMNVVWKAGSNRPFGRKVMDYLALMILLPISVNLALATETTLQNKTLFKLFSDLLPIAWLSSFLLNILPLILVIGTFTVLYRFLPNTKVRIFPALIGGFIGGTSWLFAQTLYLSLQIGVAKYNAIYGSFATLPLFLLWLYLGWLIFLGGAELSFACQTWQLHTKDEQDMTPSTKLSLAFAILERVFSSFQQGATTTQLELSNHLQRPENEIQSILDMLTDGGMIHHVLDKDTEGYAPAQPKEKLDMRQALEIIMGPRPAREHRLAAHALEAARASMVDQQL